jgi:parallel beta-helix repeat protein
MKIEKDRKGPSAAEAQRLDLTDAMSHLTRITALTAASEFLWNRAQLQTALPLIKYHADFISRAEAKRNGTSGIFLYTSGGFTIYNNTSTNTFAIFDKGLNGHAWIDGKWQDIHPGNWRLDPDQRENSSQAVETSGGAPSRPAEVYQYRDLATGNWKRVSLPSDTIFS